MKRKGRNNGDEMRPEYEFDYSKAVRGKYYRVARLSRRPTVRPSRAAHKRATG